VLKAGHQEVAVAGGLNQLTLLRRFRHLGQALYCQALEHCQWIFSDGFGENVSLYRTTWTQYPPGKTKESTFSPQAQTQTLTNGIVDAIKRVRNFTLSGLATSGTKYHL
jgi:hypothetical protein